MPSRLVRPTRLDAYLNSGRRVPISAVLQGLQLQWLGLR